MSLTFDELRKNNVARCEYHYHSVSDWTPTEWLMCVTGELGEVAHAMKELRRLRDSDDGDIDAHKQNLKDEIADVAIYLDLLASSMGIDMEDAIRKKFNRTSAKIGASQVI
jgi:NTP pyrophosphatase (non-canonical NTP hydrolase)